MSFVVDGADWHFDPISLQAAGEKIDLFLELIETSRQREEKVWIGDDFQTRPMLDDADLWTIISPGGALNLRTEVVQEMAAWLGRAAYYSDEDIWPEGLEDMAIFVEDGVKNENADLAWAHHWVRAHTPVGCLGLFSSGFQNTTSSKGSALIAWVNSERDRLAFWRGAIILAGDNEKSLQAFASNAYPSIFFHERALGRLSGLAGGYLALRSVVQYVFASLNDFGNWIFTFPPPALNFGEIVVANSLAKPSNQVIERRFKALNILAAPENPDVFRDKNCREAREISVEGVMLYCEWHIKLEPHRNRIHLHAPMPCSNNKIVVGIIDEHLPLP